MPNILNIWKASIKVGDQAFCKTELSPCRFFHSFMLPNINYDSIRVISWVLIFILHLFMTSSNNDTDTHYRHPVEITTSVSYFDKPHQKDTKIAVDFWIWCDLMGPWKQRAIFAWPLRWLSHITHMISSYLYRRRANYRVKDKCRRCYQCILALVITLKKKKVPIIVKFLFFRQKLSLFEKAGLGKFIDAKSFCLLFLNFPMVKSWSALLLLDIFTVFWWPYLTSHTFLPQSFLG